MSDPFALLRDAMHLLERRDAARSRALWHRAELAFKERGDLLRVAWSVVGAPKYSRPLKISLHAGPCTFMLCVIERSKQILSICPASRGKCSQTWIPGTFVAIC